MYYTKYLGNEFVGANDWTRESRHLENAAWDAVGPAFISSIPFCVGLAMLFTTYLGAGEDDPLFTWNLAWGLCILGAVIWAPFITRWCGTIRALREFTRRCRAYNEPYEGDISGEGATEPVSLTDEISASKDLWGNE